MKYLLLAFLFSYSLSFAVEDKLTTELNGISIAYRYEGAGHYNVKFSNKGISYRFLSGDAPNEWWGPFPYKAYKTKYGQYFVGWYEKGYGDQITLLIDLEGKTLFGSGIIMRGKKVIEHFHQAVIEKIVRE